MKKKLKLKPGRYKLTLKVKAGGADRDRHGQAARHAQGDTGVTFGVGWAHERPPHRLRHRRGLLRHRRRQGARPRRLRRHRVREVRPRRRQLGVGEHERDVLRLPLAAHQHLARAHGVLGLPDAEVLSRLPAPHPHREVLRRLRRPLRRPRPHPLRDRRRARRAAPRRRLGDRARERRDAPLRRAARRQRPPLGRALARARLPRRRGLRGRADPLARLQGRRPRLLPRQDRRRARDGQLGDGHRGRGELRRRAHLPRRPPRRARDPQVPVRQADRPDRRVDEDPVPGPAAGARGDAQGLRGRHGALRAAEARPPLRRRPPDRLRRHPLADGARHDHARSRTSRR